VVKARITSNNPKAAGSIPAVGESQRSSVAEHWIQKRSVPRIPPAKVSGVVRVCVTSAQQSALAQAREIRFEDRRLVRDSSSTKKRRPLVPTGSDTGMVGGRGTSTPWKAGLVSSALCSMIPPGLN